MRLAETQSFAHALFFGAAVALCLVSFAAWTFIGAVWAHPDDKLLVAAFSVVALVWSGLSCAVCGLCLWSRWLGLLLEARRQSQVQEV